MAPPPKKQPNKPQKSVRIAPGGGKQKDAPPEKPTRKVNMRRIAQLAKPIIRKDNNFAKNRWRVSYNALFYRATGRIKWLAYPRFMVKKVGDRKSKRPPGMVTNINPRALKYVATDRIIDLSLPKGFKYE